MDGQFTGTNLVPIDTIKVGIRLRATNPRHVIALKESIHTIGLLHPISVFLLMAFEFVIVNSPIGVAVLG